KWRPLRRKSRSAPRKPAGVSAWRASIRPAGCSSTWGMWWPTFSIKTSGSITIWNASGPTRKPWKPYDIRERTLMRAYREFASVYDRLMEDMPYGEWISFARRCFELYGMPRSVADLGCGTGNLAIPLAKSGFEVYGIDISADMLAIARSKWDAPPARGQGGTIRWLQQDMRDWELPDPVDAVISFCDCLNYLTAEEDVIRT